MEDEYARLKRLHTRLNRRYRRCIHCAKPIINMIGHLQKCPVYACRRAIDKERKREHAEMRKIEPQIQKLYADFLEDAKAYIEGSGGFEGEMGKMMLRWSVKDDLSKKNRFYKTIVEYMDNGVVIRNPYVRNYVEDLTMFLKAQIDEHIDLVLCLPNDHLDDISVFA
jgi:hypothetical protein